MIDLFENKPDNRVTPTHRYRLRVDVEFDLKGTKLKAKINPRGHLQQLAFS